MGKDELTEEERLQLLEEKTEDKKLSNLITRAVKECIVNGDENGVNVKVISEKRIKKIERDMTDIQTELVGIQEESLRLARRTLDINRNIDSLEHELTDIGFVLKTIKEGTDELKKQASNTAVDLKNLAANNAKDLKDLAKDTAKDLKEDEITGWNRKQQIGAMILVILSLSISAIALIRGF